MFAGGVLTIGVPDAMRREQRKQAIPALDTKQPVREVHCIKARDRPPAGCGCTSFTPVGFHPAKPGRPSVMSAASQPDSQKTAAAS